MRASLGRRTLCRCGLPGVHSKNAKSHVDLPFAVLISRYSLLEEWKEGSRVST